LQYDYVKESLRSLTNSVSGETFVVSGDRIARLNKSTRRFEIIQGSYPDVRSLAADKNGKLWLISTDGRLFKQI
ncbi:MAG: hypothetical protein VW274_11390, partial [Thalassolituus sp.]